MNNKTLNLSYSETFARAYVGESIENPGNYYRNNVVGTLNVLESMRDYGIANIIFSSTCATYGIPKTLPISEDHPQSAINPYGASKLMVSDEYSRILFIRIVSEKTA